jgi:hypothetical protein
MKTVDDDSLTREFDFGRAIRGRYAYRFTPEQRDAFLREAPFDDDAAWKALLCASLQSVEAALFAYLVLVGGESPTHAGVRSAALMGGEATLPRPGVDRKLATLRAARTQAEPPTGEHGREARLAWRMRMGLVLTDAGDLRAELWASVRAHLADGGLTPPEIERRTAEAARLWHAA